jgi:cellulose synthase/poly-beta-1,6-N-acetylglucosamine synthase-like glycosyltransferase
MLLKMNRWHCRYVEQYLAVGEAPDNVRQAFQQRSRWCKVRACGVIFGRVL